MVRPVAAARPIGQSREKAGPGPLSLGKLFYLGLWIEIELTAELLGVVGVPGGIERCYVADQFVHSHPTGHIGLLRKITNPRENADRVRNRVEAENADGARLGLQEAKDVFDERGFPGAVFSDKAHDRTGRHVKAHVIERQFGAITAGDALDRDDRFRARRSIHSTIRVSTVHGNHD
jgi:hypothetical protein